MSLTPTQIAELIFHISNLRFMEREYTKEPTFENRSDMIKYQTLVDDWLEKYGFDQYMNKQSILESLMDDNNLKQAV